MKYILLLLSFSAFSQETARTTFAAAGNSTMTSNGYYVSQSVGQSSTIGFMEMMDRSIIQGYQQPTGAKIIDAGMEWESIRVYPNPVSNQLNFLFSLTLEGTFDIEVFDRLGRLVFNKTLSILDYSSSTSIAHLASATYVIKIITKTSLFYETIIKH